MEAQGDPFRRGLPTLQTSLTLPELPCTATAAEGSGNFLRSLGGGCRTGKFLADWEVRGGKQCGYRAPLVGRMRGSGKALRERRFIPPHQSLTRQLPPEGKPFAKIPFVFYDRG